MYCKLNGQKVLVKNAEETLGSEFFIELKKTEKSTMLDHSILGFFYCCKLIMMFYVTMDFLKDFTRGETSIGTSSGKNLKKKIR